MRDLLPEWIKSYEDFQRMPLETSAEIDELLETFGMPPDIEETRKFLADRYNTLQDRIDEMKTAVASGSQVLMMNEDEQAGWDARVRAEVLERATRNAGS